MHHHKHITKQYFLTSSIPRPHNIASSSNLSGWIILVNTWEGVTCNSFRKWPFIVSSTWEQYKTKLVHRFLTLGKWCSWLLLAPQWLGQCIISTLGHKRQYIAVMMWPCYLLPLHQFHVQHITNIELMTFECCHTLETSITVSLSMQVHACTHAHTHSYTELLYILSAPFQILLVNGLITDGTFSPFLVALGNIKQTWEIQKVCKQKETWWRLTNSK